MDYEPQHILSPEGVPLVVITRADFERLTANAQDEDAEDIAAVLRARTESDVRYPAAVVDRILAGDKPLAAWRAHRAMTQAELARQAGVSQAGIARLERASTRGVGLLETRRAIARALDIPVAALDPVDD